MKIAIRQFLAQNYSWRFVGQAIATELIKKNHQVELFSTDGKNIAKHLQPYLVGYTELNSSNIIGHEPSMDCDLTISYTAMKNFQPYLKYGKKKFGIWCYEFIGKDNIDTLPNGFPANHVYCDKILAPSNFAKQIFLNGKIPDNKIGVIPHGIDEEYLGNSKMILPTRKSFKIFVNIAQNHKRKNIPGILKAYGKAFTKKDDICLILKVKDKPVEQGFEVSLKTCLKNFYEKYPKHGEVKVIDYFIDDLSSLYRSVDCVFSMSKCEAFAMTMLEALTSGKINIAPSYGGQLDFLSEENSLLISGKEVEADKSAMYWDQKDAIWFDPNIDDAVDKLKFAYQNFQSLNEKLEKQRKDIYQQYAWSKIVDDILKL